MLPCLAASGHNLYTKYVVIYLDKMKMLPETHPQVYQHFLDVKHFVRRSDRPWAGLSTDLVIEKELMRSLKTSGGLTRGSGMSENQRNLWVLSRPICAQVNNSMQILTGVHKNTSEQNKDLSLARQKQDMIDTGKIQHYFKDRNPFEIEDDLVSISSGIHAHPSVNVEEARENGIEILKEMDGQITSSYTL